MQLASAITTELSDETRSGVVAHETSDVEAWELYANGRYQVDRRDASSLRRAIGFFEAALRRDRRFARASAGLSDAHTLTAVFGIEPASKAFGEARAAAINAALSTLVPEIVTDQTAREAFFQVKPGSGVDIWVYFLVSAC